jgi:hypothetical protein
MQRANGSSLIRGSCLVEGCSRLQANKGLMKCGPNMGKKMYSKFCDMHRRMSFSSKVSPSEFFKHKSVPNDKCSVCGWDKGPCDRHRIIPEKGYCEGNVIIFCPNCHRLQSLGLLPS